MPRKPTKGTKRTPNADTYDPKDKVETDPSAEPGQGGDDDGEGADAGPTVFSETSADGYDSFDVTKHFPQNGFAFVVAPRRNGKTEHVLSWLRQFHKQKRFTHYFVVSQTLSGYEECIPMSYQFTTLDNLPTIVERMQKVALYNKGQDRQEDMVKCSICVILDDMVGDPKEVRQSGGILQKIAVNGRHVCREDPCESNEMCTILISQRVTLIPPAVRNNADVILASRLASYVERKTLIENYLSLTSDKEGLREARRVFDNITLSKEFRFIAISTHIPNRSSHRDYVHYCDANIKEKNVRLFGTDDDWKLEKPDIVF